MDPLGIAVAARSAGFAATAVFSPKEVVSVTRMLSKTARAQMARRVRAGRRCVTDADIWKINGKVKAGANSGARRFVVRPAGVPVFPPLSVQTPTIGTT